ncbi:LacI family DNA-binding transcriptional regulator [Gramella sp. AN32]|uniref:Substrate-binding domain-containing protein n=1 Tax=Christiangramia antarctica TaxID=2058158 RepID=A0ABW5X1J3_9FLAO|nr:LacI family DNA-binding transcriptional regulator [Gramella sp. AN32]MCM4156715.1 hypothetical protein [Gramella sp. AN32]
MAAPPTIKEIAKRANVSIGTVDRVIHKRGKVSKKNQKLIEDIMSELNYTPNVNGRNLSLNKTYKIALLIPEEIDDGYWSAPLEGVKKAQNIFRSSNLAVHYYLYKKDVEESFQEKSNKILNDDCDGVIMAPQLYNEANLFLRKCAERSLPFVLIDFNLSDMEPLTYIGQNAFQSGRLAGELLSLGKNESSTFLVMNITGKGDKNVIFRRRIEGFQSYLNEKLKDFKVEVFSIFAGDIALKQKINEKIQKVIPDLSAIFITNSKSYLIADCLPQNESIRVLGYDLLMKNRALLKDGKIQMLIHQRPIDQGYMAVECMYQYLVTKQKPPEEIVIPLDIVTPENAMFY